MGGYWEEIVREWWETSITNCSLCGQMIPSKVWIVEEGGRKLMLCSPDCERLYRRYWVPRYGLTTGRPS
jgi:ribosomal protein L24E